MLCNQGGWVKGANKKESIIGTSADAHSPTAVFEQKCGIFKAVAILPGDGVPPSVDSKEELAEEERGDAETPQELLAVGAFVV